MQKPQNQGSSEKQEAGKAPAQAAAGTVMQRLSGLGQTLGRLVGVTRSVSAGAATTLDTAGRMKSVPARQVEQAGTIQSRPELHPEAAGRQSRESLQELAENALNERGYDRRPPRRGR